LKQGATSKNSVVVHHQVPLSGSPSHWGKTAYLYLNTVSSQRPRRFLFGDHLLDQPNELRRADKE
ncbi:MAG TPA: hypothetical protein VIY29_11665, partial [Ktedonobacteraceae bacterium]